MSAAAEGPGDQGVPDDQRLYESLHRRLADREWPIGTAIPTIAALRQEYGIQSLRHVRRAQGRLVEEGYLRIQTGVGVFVMDYPPPDKALLTAALADVDDALRALGRAREAIARHLQR
jgi:DNA-binding GntR family transcriptional regulator